MKRTWLIFLLAVPFFGCSESSGGGSAGAGGDGGGGTGGSPALTYPLIDCDPIVPEFCAYPFPSNVHTVESDDTVSGRLVSFDDETFLLGNDSGPWDYSDGFSAGGPILTMLPGATGEELNGSTDIPASLEDDSPTIVLDAVTGDRIAHFAEIDVRATEAERSIIIYPAVRMLDNARYIVAIRGLKNAGGSVIEASPAFAALRDQGESDEPSVDARRGLYEDIFGKLGEAGWTREDVQVAWDFNTASDQNNTSWLLKMRDEALELECEDGPDYTITSETDVDPTNIIVRIEGTYRVPNYMRAPEGSAIDPSGPGTVLNLDENGVPQINPDAPCVDAPFMVMIPKSADVAPGTLLQYGHGLFGSGTQHGANYFRDFMNQYNYVMFGTDLKGMSDEDFGTIVEILLSGNYSRMQTMFDRLHQGFLNYLVLMRMMRTSFAADDDYGQYIDPDEAYYHGISQGGIMGSVYMAVSTEVSRGALGVMGQPYSLLLFRSVDFDQFLTAINFVYKDKREHQLLVAISQMLWDRVEPNGYTHHLRSENLLPGAREKEVLMRAALVDHQVVTLAGHIMARTAGAQHLDSGVRDIWDLTKVPSTESGHLYTEYDFDLPGQPNCNFPPTGVCADPHEWIRRRESSARQLDEFLRDGTGTVHCSDDETDPPAVADGVCRYTVTDHTDKYGRLMNQCTPEDTPASVEALCVPPEE